MTIVKLHFYLLVVCGATEYFTELSVNFGENATLKCELSVKDVHWFLLKPSEPPVYILETFSSQSTTAKYNNTLLKRTFSVKFNSSLFIRNISTNELGVYYCIQTSNPDISGIRLFIQNQSAGDFNQRTKTCMSDVTPKNQMLDPDLDVALWRSLFITLGIINCVLAVVIAVRHCRRSTQTRVRPPDLGLTPQQDNNIPVYDEIQYNATNGCVRTANFNSTYALLQAPNP